MCSTGTTVQAPGVVQGLVPYSNPATVSSNPGDASPWKVAECSVTPSTKPPWAVGSVGCGSL